MPERTGYFPGSNLNTQGLVLTAHYSNGTTKRIDEGFTCTPTSFVKEDVGNKVITVSYEGKTTSFNVLVATISVSMPKPRVGETVEWRATTSPPGLTVKWKTDNPSVVSLDKYEGEVVHATALSGGNVTASAYLYVDGSPDYYASSSWVSVPQPSLSFYSENINEDVNFEELNDVGNIGADGITGMNSWRIQQKNMDSYPPVNWSVSPSGHIDAEGRLVVQQPGSYRITASCEYLGKTYTATCNYTFRLLAVGWWGLEDMRSLDWQRHIMLSGIEGTTFEITELMYSFNVWGKITYYGETGWILLPTNR